MRARRATGTLLTAVALGLLLATPMLAGDKKVRQNKRGQAKSVQHYDKDDDGHGNNGKNVKQRREANSVQHANEGNHLPELDPGVAGSAAVLLIGGTLVLAGRRRRAPKG